MMASARMSIAQIDNSSFECAGSTRDPRDRLGSQSLIPIKAFTAAAHVENDDSEIVSAIEELMLQ